MTADQLDFVTFCIGNLSIRLNMPQKVVYIKLKDSGILDDYIVRGYDVLHTFGKEYLMNDSKHIIIQAKNARIDVFYHSVTAQMIQDGVADLHCRSDHYLADEIYREYSEV